MDINRWNGNNFPYKAVRNPLDGSITIYKYLLDNLEGDVNLEDAPCIEIRKGDE